MTILRDFEFFENINTQDFQSKLQQYKNSVQAEENLRKGDFPKRSFIKLQKEKW